MKTIRSHLTIFFSLFLVCNLAAFPAIAGDDVTIGAEKWELIDRFTSTNGEVILRVRPKKIETTADKIAGGTLKAEAPPAPTSGTAPQAPTTSQAAKIDAAKKDIAGDLADILKKETDIMDSSGLTLLGVTATDINRPVSPRDFAFSVARGVDASGKVKTGMAVEIAPVSLFAPQLIVGGEEYVKSRWMQAAARTSISLATAKSEDAKIGSQVAGSLRVGLYDGGDPRMKWEILDDCSRLNMKKFNVDLAEFMRKNPSATEEEIKKKSKDLELQSLGDAVKCYRTNPELIEFAHSAWRQPTWYAGYAKAWYTGSSGQIQDSMPGAKVFWTSYSQGWDLQKGTMKGLMQLYASKKWDDRIQDTKDPNKLSNEDRTDLIARYRIGRENWNVFFDAGLARVTNSGVLSQNVRRMGYGVEYKISDDMWFIVGSVTERGYVSGDSKRTLLNTGIRFGQTDKSTLWPTSPLAKTDKKSE